MNFSKEFRDVRATGKILYLHLRVREKCRPYTDIQSASYDATAELPKCDVFVTGDEVMIAKYIHGRNIGRDEYERFIETNSDGYCFNPAFSNNTSSVQYLNSGWEELRTRLSTNGWECIGRCITSHPIVEHGTTTYIEYITQEAFENK